MKTLDSSSENLTRWVLLTEASTVVKPEPAPRLDYFRPIRNWLNQIHVQDESFARSICKLIPAQCPFEREIKVLGRTIVSIPPLCKLNPVYEEVVSLRFRALCYLADECGVDVSPYC